MRPAEEPLLVHLQIDQHRFCRARPILQLLDRPGITQRMHCRPSPEREMFTEGRRTIKRSYNALLQRILFCTRLREMRPCCVEHWAGCNLRIVDYDAI